MRLRLPYRIAMYPMRVCFCEELLAKTGSQFLTIIDLRQLRGKLEHFSTTNEVRRLIKNPTDKLLGRPDEQGAHVRCPNPTMWQMCRQSVGIDGACRSNEKEWRKLPQCNLVRLLCAEGGFPFPSERGGICAD